MDRWEWWYHSPGSVRITTQDGAELLWHDLYLWAVRDDNAPSRPRPDKTERARFDLPEGHPPLAKGSVLTVEVRNWGFAGKAVVLCDVPLYTRGVSPRRVQLEWVR